MDMAQNQEDMAKSEVSQTQITGYSGTSTYKLIHEVVNSLPVLVCMVTEAIQEPYP